LSWLRVIPLAAPVLGQTQLALAVESWRRLHGPDLGGWLDAAGRAEALCSLATYAFENPADPFPEIIEPGPCMDGRALAHPLMPRGTCVPNDLTLGREPQLLVVSGSNMSGKSTFLRTVGVNAVLALAGAPVRAERLRLSPLAIGATLRVEDSLQRGQSRFYAEITRLRQILDLAKGPVPVLFLLDELLSGTNSEDRRAGAEAVLRRLADTGAIGLVTTHDLALTSVADGLGAAGANVHFDERLEGDRLAFDDTLCPGVVRQRKPLALMRAVGINV
jgi:DNA mismatch repair ATPase MutS